MVTAGAAYGATEGEPPVRLETGDVIVFPQGDPHVISSGPGMRGTIDYRPFETARACPLPIGLRLDGGGAERARVTCGFLGLGAEDAGFASLVRLSELLFVEVVRRYTDTLPAESRTWLAADSATASRTS